MRKEFQSSKESFSSFSSTLVAGDTVVFKESASEGEGLALVADLLRRGIVVRVPQNESLESEIRKDADVVEQFLHLATAIDRKAAIIVASRSGREKTTLQAEKMQKAMLQAKVDRLIAEDGLSIVAACRKVHCRPSDYYIYKQKLKRSSYVR